MQTDLTARVVPVLIAAAAVLSVSALTGGRVPAASSAAAYDLWTADQLVKPGNLGNYGNHSASIQRRQPGAPPESHTGFSDILMFTGGEGSFIVGGEIVDGPDG